MSVLAGPQCNMSQYSTRRFIDNKRKRGERRDSASLQRGVQYDHTLFFLQNEIKSIHEILYACLSLRACIYTFHITI